MTNNIYTFKITSKEAKLLGENKLYLSLKRGRTYTYEQLVTAYKQTEYLSIDDFMIDNEIVSYSTLHDGDYGYCDTSYISLPYDEFVLIVAVCN